jgi:hypothetical protein
MWAVLLSYDPGMNCDVLPLRVLQMQTTLLLSLPPSRGSHEPLSRHLKSPLNG